MKNYDLYKYMTVRGWSSIKRVNRRYSIASGFTPWSSIAYIVARDGGTFKSLGKSSISVGRSWWYNDFTACDYTLMDGDIILSEREEREHQRQPFGFISSRRRLHAPPFLRNIPSGWRTCIRWTVRMGIMFQWEWVEGWGRFFTCGMLRNVLIAKVVYTMHSFTHLFTTNKLPPLCR